VDKGGGEEQALCGQTGGLVILPRKTGTRRVWLQAWQWRSERRPCRKISLCLEDGVSKFFLFFLLWRIPYHLDSTPPHVGQTDGLCSLPRISAISFSPRFPTML